MDVSVAFSLSLFVGLITFGLWMKWERNAVRE